ncbi:hypothetical protein PR048_004410 [Dryococelus australis]|uniref:Uncharacterized protein n=1 Tax=Dryococelus australis TaxID=614101 RepID=A0ABQ9I5E4_9NEOP|nr:hypothetical protein PR048_004410 [Dryococelus australis]
MCATSPVRRRLNRRHRQVHTLCSAPVSSQHCGRVSTVRYGHADKMALIPCCGRIAWSSNRWSLRTTPFYPPLPHTHHCRSSMPCTSLNVTTSVQWNCLCWCLPIVVTFSSEINGQVYGMFKCNKSQREIASVLNVSRTCVAQTIAKYRESGEVHN